MIKYGVNMAYTNDAGLDPINLDTVEWTASIGGTQIRFAEWFSPDPVTSTVDKLPGWSHSTESFEAIAVGCRERGLDITYTIYITDHEGTNIGFRPLVADPLEFFRSYTEILADQARLAQTIGADTFCIGVEMGAITSMYPDLWANAIAAVRQNFSGSVTYAANFNCGPWYDPDLTSFQTDNEALTLAFGSLLDYIGLDMYLPGPVEPSSSKGSPQVWTTGQPTVEEVILDWDNLDAYGYSHIALLRKIYDKWHKPLDIIETGFNSVPLGASLSTPGVTQDQLAQATLWEAELRMLNFYAPDIVYRMTHFNEFVWDAGRQLGMSVKGKLAESVLRAWFEGDAQKMDHVIPLSPNIEFAFGLRGDDVFLPAPGQHVIDGKDGIDTVWFMGLHAAYVIATLGSDAWQVVAIDRSREDSVANVERLRFADKSIAIDLDGAGGNTAKLIGAIFGEQYLIPEFVGIGLSFFDAGWSMQAVAQLALNTDLYAQLAGSRSNADFVRLVYENVVGVEPGAADQSYFQGILDRGEMTLAQMAVMAAETAENAANIDLIGLSNSGIEFIPFGG